MSRMLVHRLLFSGNRLISICPYHIALRGLCSHHVSCVQLAKHLESNVDLLTDAGRYCCYLWEQAV